MSIFGYFDSPAQESPAFDPGLAMPCPFCLLSLHSGPRKTISLMAEGDPRSYFYRAHKFCYENASPQEVCAIESSLIDSKEGS